MFVSVDGGQKRLVSAKNSSELLALNIPLDLDSNTKNLNSQVNLFKQNITQNDEYILKRQRNNAAVNKTRQKKRLEEMSTQSRVQKLRDENDILERFFLTNNLALVAF